MAPLGAILLLVVPIVMVTLNDYSSVAIVIIPASMQSAITLVEPNARATIVVIAVAVVIIAVAADAEVKTLRACDGRRGNR
jgi:hypothetical protein